MHSSHESSAAADLSQLQTKFGQGAYINGVATAPTTITQSSDWGLQGWGPKLDGRQVIGIDGIQRPYTYAGNNFDRFYNTGSAWTNGVSFT